MLIRPFRSSKCNIILYILLMVFLCPSCTEYSLSEKKLNEISRPFDTKGVVPKTDTLKTATVIDLKKCPAPKVTVLGKDWSGEHKTGGNKTNGSHFSLPISKSAGFCAAVTGYNAEQGLYSTVISILKDASGNLWFATGGGGVVRYDGKTSTSYTNINGLANNSVFSILEDKNGDLWFGTYGGGVSRYDGRTFKTYTTAQGLAGDIIYCIIQDRKGNLWLGSEGGGVSRYDGKTFTTYTTRDGLSNNTIRSILEDKEGNLWFGTNGGGVCKFDGRSFSNYTNANGLANNSVLTIKQDRKGNIWFGTYGGGVSCYNGKSFVSFSDSQGIGGKTVWSIFEDKQGDIWIGTKGGGLTRYDGKRLYRFTKSEGLVNNSVMCIAEDNDGCLWLGTYGGGVTRYDGSAFTTFTTAQGMGCDNVSCVTEDKRGNLWLGTYDGGAIRYDGSTFTSYTHAQGMASNIVFDIRTDRKNNLWFSTNDSGICKYDGKTLTRYTTAQGLGHNTSWVIFEDKKGNLWFGTDGGGVSRYDGETMITYTTSQGLANNTVYCILQDSTGNLWFGTGGGGVSCFNGETFTNYGTAQGLGSNFIRAIALDRCGNIWCGSDGGGISRFDGRSFSTYTTSQGLSNNSIFSIVEDDNGNLWFGTNEGICGLTGFKCLNADPAKDSGGSCKPYNRLTNLMIFENYAPVFETYNFRNGYPVKDVNTLFRDSKGIIWIGSSDKLVRFDYSAIRRNHTPPKIFINTIKVGDEKICWTDLLRKNVKNDSTADVNDEVGLYGSVLTEAKRENLIRKFGSVQFDSVTPFYHLPVHLCLPYRLNKLSFDFAAVEPAKPYLVNYQYKLVGYDNDWNPVTTKTTATFGNIHEGTYTFLLKALSPDGVWTEPLAYTFKVLPPVYRTWWAYAFYILSVTCLIYLLFRWRIAALRREKDSLEEIVRERTKQLVVEKKEVEKQKQRSDELLLNILPEEVAFELKDTGSSAARHYDNVTVMFTDFVGFTKVSEQMEPQTLINELHHCFKSFDEIAEKYNLEKIKTIGDAYLAVCGLPKKDPRHAQNAVLAAREIIQFMKERNKQLGRTTFPVRVGICSGSVVAGIVGSKKFAFDIWGDTVNTASRMEQKSEEGKINISQSTYELVKDDFVCICRGEIEVKNKGLMRMYFVE